MKGERKTPSGGLEMLGAMEWLVVEWVPFSDPKREPCPRDRINTRVRPKVLGQESGGNITAAQIRGATNTVKRTDNNSRRSDL